MSRRVVASLLGCLLLAGCPRWAGPTRRPAVDVLVIAPHPDDEILLAAGVLRRAVEAGQRAAVLVLTNGDLGCERDGEVRQAETVAALEALGLTEDDVHFLGYPDGHLALLGEAPLPAVAHLQRGVCGVRAMTTAARGAGRRDVHARRTGRGAPFTAEALTGDLAALLAELAPHDVYLPHGIDAHPDHAATYVYFRRALDRLEHGPRTVHRGVVHAGRCWPTDCAQPYQPTAMMPPLPEPLAAYAPDERLPVAPAWKLRLIARFASQTGPSAEQDWLAGFARREEVFFTERLVRQASGRWVSEGSTAVTAHELRRGLPGGLQERTVWNAGRFARLEISPAP